MKKSFIIHKPTNPLLESFVDYYFYVDISVKELALKDEYILPFPRITFGYFFDHPFLVTNNNINESQEIDMIISKISTNKITVKPISDRVRVIGAHVRPYALAALTETNISTLPWLIDTISLFKDKAKGFREKINNCKNPEEMFVEVDNIFFETQLPDKDLSTIINAVELIENNRGNIEITKVANTIGVSDRTLRNHFYKHVGCSPKEYINLLKLKQSVNQMKNEDESLTTITYAQNYSDQAHFTNSVKTITGYSPKEIQKKITDFRFLQF
ncbi:helix-turn-helix domain-containing protein [Flammeovirga kamogawensis]|uniref:Helix-turn-helix transcriptional regulator n=1 Tax=Flammeovirga kamogawensis TaxID=373891 RepID=A0ABX8H561_9BACT|nr:AraC family transcriptional regulator [Flammeovirga kamogawensis]MBB6463507.1 AraC-like DNA-binding protein [Flammeovirga kamogawensis]QWG10566.1 helix-turn-helix transcriptional regulator [Flammeovirga kamogawensis]TRX63672.1 helix-turn-helix transcriptional regulator [Flammeovirga kamogawensis]